MNRAKPTWLTIPCWLDKDGYLITRLPLGKRHLKVHRLVMMRTLGRPLDSDECVHHINGDRLDNRPENLEVRSPAEHATFHMRGSTRPWQRKELPEQAALDYQTGCSLAKLADIYGVSIPTARKRLVEKGVTMRPPVATPNRRK